MLRRGYYELRKNNVPGMSWTAGAIQDVGLECIFEANNDSECRLNVKAEKGKGVAARCKH